MAKLESGISRANIPGKTAKKLTFLSTVKSCGTEKEEKEREKEREKETEATQGGESTTETVCDSV